MKFRSEFPVRTFLTAAMCFAACWSVKAQSPRDVRFSKELNSIELFDFSELFLTEKMKSVKPADMDAYRAQLADTYLYQNKFDKAKKMIDALPKGSVAAYEGSAALGVYFFRKNNYPEAVKYLAPVFKYCKEKKADPKDWEAAAVSLLNIYNKQGMVKQSNEVRQWIQGTQEGDRGQIYASAAFAMTTVENLKKQEAEDREKLKKTPNPAMANKFKQMDARRAKLASLFARRDDINDNDINELKRGNDGDWKAVIYQQYYEFERVQWGGMDVLSAFSAAQIGRAFFLLEEYENGINAIRKYRDLFDACDEAYPNDPENSPSADARYWEGRCNFAIAQKMEQQKKNLEASKYYKRAFKSFGRMLKKAGKHKDAPQAYIDFLTCIEKVSKFEPKHASVLSRERNKVLPPTLAKTKKAERIMTVTAADNFKSGKYAEVVKELMPIMAAKRTSSGMPELLFHLTLALANTEDDFTALTVGNLMGTLYQTNSYTSKALSNAGNVFWKKSDELRRSKQYNQEKVEKLRDSAIEFYEELFRFDISNLNAHLFALRIAREYFNRAKILADAINKQSNAAKKIEMKKRWFELHDKSIKAYQFILDNFSSQPDLMDESYSMIAESYSLMERYEDAAKVYTQYCEYGSENIEMLAKAKENIAESLYKIADAKEKESQGYLEEAAAIIVPVVPPMPQDPSKSGAESADPAKAKAEYEAKVKEVQKAEKEASVIKQKKAAREKDAAETGKEAKVLFKRAIDSLMDFNRWFQGGGKYGYAANKPEIKKVISRSQSLMPWLYDGAGDKQKAINAFSLYINLHQNSPDAKKTIPAYMLRMGVLYTELGKDAQAQQVLESLSKKYPDSTEGKNAKFFLARNLYQKGSYDKAMLIFKEIFSSALINNLSISNFRWISTNLVSCPNKKNEIAAAEYAIKSCEELLKKVERPVVVDWVGPIRAAEFAKDSAKASTYFKQTKEKILLDCGLAYMKTGNYVKAVNILTLIEKMDENTPYYNEMYLARAESYRQLKRYDEARKDLARISSRANILKQFMLYNKAQTMIGETYFEQKNYTKAFAVYNIVAAPAFRDGNDPAVLKSSNPKDDSLAYLELAIYKTAWTASILGKGEDKKVMVEKYKKNFPRGKYKTEIDHLPAAATK